MVLFIFILFFFYLEFREVRLEHEFFKVCRTPELACEVTMQVSTQMMFSLHFISLYTKKKFKIWQKDIIARHERIVLIFIYDFDIIKVTIFVLFIKIENINLKKYTTF